MADTSDGGFWQGLGREGRFVIGLVIIALIVLGVVLVPEQLVAFDSSEPATTDQINAARRTLVQFLGGFAVLVGLWLTARRIRASERRAEALEDQIRVTEQGQVTERFTRAIEQLGSDTLQIRLGGIYSLERIAKDSADDHWTVMEVLCAFVREKSSVQQPVTEADETQNEEAENDDVRTQEKVATDVEAALQVIGRRDIQQDPLEHKKDIFGTETARRSRLNLRNIHIRDANLEGLNFSLANFDGSELHGSLMRQTNLKGAIFYEANLRNVNFVSSNLSETAMIDADLSHAKMYSVNFKGAILDGADLSFSKLNALRVIPGSDFDRPEFNRGLRSAAGLTTPQICRCKSLYESDLDPALEAAVREQCPELLEPTTEE